MGSAAQVPGVELISPPPHHDIYSIEDGGVYGVYRHCRAVK